MVPVGVVPPVPSESVAESVSLLPLPSVTAGPAFVDKVSTVDWASNPARPAPTSEMVAWPNIEKAELPSANVPLAVPEYPAVVNGPCGPDVALPAGIAVVLVSSGDKLSGLAQL